MADTAVAAPTKAPKKKTAGDLGEIIMCFFNNFYDNFPYDSVKTSFKFHVKIFIRHSPIRRAYKYTVASFQVCEQSSAPKILDSLQSK
jgi:hypothetical protein